MPVDMFPQSLAMEIKQIFAKYPADADNRIELFLNARLNQLAWPERIKRVQQVAAHLDENTLPPQDETKIQNDIIRKLFPLLLGRKATSADLESNAQLESLARALNTIFDTLNRIIDVINTTLRGTSFQHETIRGLIGQSIVNQSSASSMVAYLGQIEQAFLISQEAMKKATRDIVDEILSELDPETLESSHIGPLKRKKMLNELKDKHYRCRRWFQSKRFEERLLRAFEKSCNQHFGS